MRWAICCCTLSSADRPGQTPPGRIGRGGVEHELRFFPHPRRIVCEGLSRDAFRLSALSQMADIDGQASHSRSPCTHSLTIHECLNVHMKVVLPLAAVPKPPCFSEGDGQGGKRNQRP
jgi:hypothetical protein